MYSSEILYSTFQKCQKISIFTKLQVSKLEFGPDLWLNLLNYRNFVFCQFQVLKFEILAHFWLSKRLIFWILILKTYQIQAKFALLLLEIAKILKKYWYIFCMFWIFRLKTLIIIKGVFRFELLYLENWILPSNVK